MKYKHWSLKLFLFVFILGFGLISASFVQAQADPCAASTEGKTRAQLQADLDACTAEINRLNQQLNATKATSASYSRDIAALTARINSAQANIKKKNLAIADLSKNIAKKEATIVELDNRIVRGKASIADILRKTNDIDSYSLAEAILSEKNLSEFFVDVDTYSSTQEALDRLFDEIRGTRKLTEAEKAELAKQREAESAARAAIEAAKREVEVTQNEKKALLAQSQSQEQSYAQVIADKQAKAARIRAALFPLRDTGAIQFGTALQYAEEASAKTGVRPALILGILQQESNLGQNVGTCVITDLNSGQTKSITSGKVFLNGIHPTRDLPALQALLRDLGGDPLTTKVSCPLSIGYGGAMGPAQFIPSTWNIMKGKVGAALGKTTPNPWDARDAIMAMALYLKDIMGTTGDRTTDERTAACRYYSGRTCYGPNGANVGLSYGNQVIAKANNIQLTMINPLKDI